MKHQNKNRWLRPTLFSLALACSPSLIQAQGVNDFVVDQFTTSSGGWNPNYGNAPMTIEWDSTQDHGPGASPGAMKVTINFDLCTLGGGNQRDFETVLASALDLTTYTKLHFSMKVDPSSSRLSDWGGGAFGNLRPHIRLGNWGGDGNLSAPDSQWVGTDAYGTWVDYERVINQTDNLPTKVAAAILGIDIWSGWGSCAAPIGHTNTVVFWLDNIWFEKNTNLAPPPPPTMKIAKPGAIGVQITADNNGDQWQRNAITTPSAGGPYLWNSQGTYPVTYTYTIGDFPSTASGAGFEAHMYVVNGDTSPGNALNGAADWNSPDIFMFRVENSGAGSLARIEWKTNLPNANPLADPIYHPLTVTGSSVVGTWTLTFTSPTNGTVTGPGISATNFTMPSEAVVNNFSPGASYIQFGTFKNDGANDGHNNQKSGTYSQVTFTGAASPFNDTFNGALLTSNYDWRKTDAPSVQHIPAGTAWLVDWSQPAIGFNAQFAPTVDGPWTPASFTRMFDSGSRTHGLVAQAALPSTSATFFRLIKRPFVKLQVLMPGETNAPNTLTGKSGTPTVQTAGVGFNVTVNAVDSVWNVVSSTDTVHLTSTDAGATLPADAAMSLGTATLAVTMNTSGSWTVTATDVTDGTKTANTSTAVVIP